MVPCKRERVVVDHVAASAMQEYLAAGVTGQNQHGTNGAVDAQRAADLVEDVFTFAFADVVNNQHGDVMLFAPAVECAQELAVIVVCRLSRVHWRPDLGQKVNDNQAQAGILGAVACKRFNGFDAALPLGIDVNVTGPIDVTGVAKDAGNAVFNAALIAFKIEVQHVTGNNGQLTESAAVHSDAERYVKCKPTLLGLGLSGQQRNAFGQQAVNYPHQRRKVFSLQVTEPNAARRWLGDQLLNVTCRLLRNLRREVIALLEYRRTQHG